MLLELDNEDIWKCINSPEVLASKVAEAMKVLSQRPAASRSVHFATASSVESPPPPSQALAPPPGLGHAMEAPRESYAEATKTLSSRFAAILGSEELVGPQAAPSSATSEPPPAPDGKLRMFAIDMDVEPAFNTPVNSSYIPYAGNKRKDLEPSPEPSSGAGSSGGVDHLQLSATAGTVARDLVPGRYVQVSAGTSKSLYKNRIFRILAVHTKGSDLEYLDDQETTRPNVKNHLLLVPGP